MALTGNNTISGIVEAFVPAYKNLYEVTFTDENLDSLAIFGATRVSFGDESLSFVRNPATKSFTLGENSYKRSDTLSITWRESDKYLIKKYHERWLSLFYNRATDKYISSTNDDQREARYKTIQIRIPSAVGNNSTLFEFVCLPSNIGNLDLAWGSNASITEYTLSYFVESWTMKEETVNQ